MINLINSLYWVTNYCLLYFGYNLNIKDMTMIVALNHATIVTSLSAISLFNYGYDFNRENLFFEIVVSDLSMTYFIFDLIMLLLFERDIIYIIHHLVTIVSISTILRNGFGSSLCMIVLFFGELTNPFRLAKQMIYKHNKFTYNVLNFLFSWLFIIIRGPILTYYSFLAFNEYIPKLGTYSKIKLIPSLLIALFGGYYWLFLLIKKKLK